MARYWGHGIVVLVFYYKNRGKNCGTVFGGRGHGIRGPVFGGFAVVELNIQIK